MEYILWSIYYIERYPDYYKTVTGEKPFKDWLEGLRNVPGRAKIRVRLDRVRQGNLGDHKHIENGVWELRIDYGPGYRVYYGKDGNRLVLLLIGGDNEYATPRY